jgi:hypothetical protein
MKDENDLLIAEITRLNKELTSAQQLGCQWQVYYYLMEVCHELGSAWCPVSQEDMDRLKTLAGPALFAEKDRLIADCKLVLECGNTLGTKHCAPKWLN